MLINTIWLFDENNMKDDAKWVGALKANLYQPHVNVMQVKLVGTFHWIDTRKKSKPFREKGKVFILLGIWEKTLAETFLFFDWIKKVKIN